VLAQCVCARNCTETSSQCASNMNIRSPLPRLPLSQQWSPAANGLVLSATAALRAHAGSAVARSCVDRDSNVVYMCSALCDVIVCLLFAVAPSSCAIIDTE
jgi:hypothetical protein